MNDPNSFESITGSAKDSVQKLKEEANEITSGALKENTSARYRAIAYLTALGLEEKEIAKQLGLSTKRVKLITSSQSFQSEVSVIQEELFLKNPQKIFLKILPKAMSRAYDIMMKSSTKDTVAIDAAFKFMDRALGKPVQEVKTEVKGVRELIDKLDEQKQLTVTPEEKKEAIDAEISPIEEAITDEVDKFIKENY